MVRHWNVQWHPHHRRKRGDWGRWQRGGRRESEKWREGRDEREAIEGKRELNVEEWSNIGTHTHTHTQTQAGVSVKESIYHIIPTPPIYHPQTPPLPPTTPSQQVSDSPLSNSCQITISQTRHPASCPSPSSPFLPHTPLLSSTLLSGPPLCPPVPLFPT